MEIHPEAEQKNQATELEMRVIGVCSESPGVLRTVLNSKADQERKAGSRRNLGSKVNCVERREWEG